MFKIEDKILDQCTQENCEQNEFLILPENVDVAFEDYYHHKAALIRNVRNLYAPLNENELMLEYPISGNHTQIVFNQFFESPYVVSKNLDFRGLFAIDVTRYINYFHTDSFKQLIAYTQQNPQMVFLLLVRSKNPSAANNMYNLLTKYISIEKREIQLPGVDHLCMSTVNELEHTLKRHVTRDAKKEIHRFLEDNSLGYEFINNLTGALKQINATDNINVQDMRKALNYTQKTEREYTSFGY